MWIFGELRHTARDERLMVVIWMTITAESRKRTPARRARTDCDDALGRFFSPNVAAYLLHLVPSVKTR
jgi:hypothetical protein